MQEGWLEGWKAIADYINTAAGTSLSPSTVRNYVSVRDAIPVHWWRGRVRALARELDTWIKRSTGKRCHRRTARAAA